ncbi:helix-turn-helix transcriptional regulator [Microbacterium sp. ZW T5_56]|uniref:helix-turn-helix transcriptional regulator n=1 Tax=Microbacterium sp. ZW T5_56 TaxID=3378081 RepID=UPI003854E054
MKLLTPSDLARLVKNARVQRSLTQQDVADAVGITRQSLARLERGNGGTSFDTVLLILDHLGIHLDATTDRDTPAPAAVATSGAAQAAAEALNKQILFPASRGLTERLSVPGSVLINPPRAAKARVDAAEARADADPDAVGGIE